MNKDGRFIKGQVPWNKSKPGYKLVYKKAQDCLGEVLRLVEEGKSALDIAGVVGINPKTIYNLLDEEGVEKLKANGKAKTIHNKLSDEQLEVMLGLSKQGRGIDAIGKKLGIDGTSVRYRLIKMLGKEEYSKRHSKKKYTDYWSGRYFINERGDRLQSGLEEKVVDYLFKLGIEYRTQVCLKLPEGKFYPDIQVGNKYIEIFGMSDLDFYIKKMEIKKKVYEKNKIDCLYLYKEDFKKEDYKALITAKL